jgi:hypothetical protein
LIAAETDKHLLPGLAVAQRVQMANGKLDLLHASVAPDSAGDKSGVLFLRVDVTLNQIATVDGSKLRAKLFHASCDDLPRNLLGGAPVRDALCSQSADRQRSSRN